MIYLAVLAGCVLVTLPLEVWLHTGVYRRWRRLSAAVLPVAVGFLGWDLWAIAHDQWWYDGQQIVGVTMPGDLPLEELLFFLVIPTCAVLALEAVRVTTGWRAGDE